MSGRGREGWPTTSSREEEWMGGHGLQGHGGDKLQGRGGRAVPLRHRI
jgi:hypothetical protein